MPSSLPKRIHLPSGLVVCLDDRAARAAAPVALRARTPCLSHRAILTAPGVLSGEGDRKVAFDELALRDAHTLRALIAWAGVVPETPGDFTCCNCGAPFEASPSALLETGPFVDGELDDPDLDAPFAFDRPHPIPPLRAGAHLAREIRLAPRTAGEALALFRLDPAAPLRITPAVVAAMGVAALGRERRATVIADALASAPERAFQAVVDLFHEAHYPARLAGVHLCKACGARNDLDVPLEREIGRASLEGSPADASGGGFPDLDAFEVEVRQVADDVYRARGVRNIGLFIEAGPPDCDEGGEPLLGSYTPGAPEGDLAVAEPPEIRLYYRSFRAQHEEEGPYDVREEIRETIDHEVTHHLNHMAGEDPLDDEEQAEITKERRRLVGRREDARRARRGLGADLVGFARTTWPVWLLVLAGSLLAWCGR